MTASAQQPPSQREKKRSETRERVFQAAVAEFSRVGFANAQIPRIAQAAGVVRGTFYFHFQSKDHVLIELAERDQETTAAELAALRGSRASLADVLARLIDSVTPSDDLEPEANLRRDVLALYMRAAGNDADDEADADEPGKPQPVLDELSHHFGEAIARGELRDDVEPERLAATVLTSIFGLVVARNGTASEQRPELELLIELLLHGMAPTGAAASRP
jgi:TetR/AcrR family transcriptional repressor of uid operon